MTSKKLFILKYAVLSILALTILTPFWLMLINSFKTKDEALRVGIGFPTNWQIIENYSKVIEKGNILNSFFNSLIITISNTIILILISSMAAYLFSRSRSVKIRFIFYLFLIEMMIPPAVIMTVLLLKNIGLLGSRIGMIIFYSGVLLPFPIFLLTGFVNTIPKEIEESAIIDGASPFKTFLFIIFPLLRPAIATSAIWSIMAVWNDFMYPLFILGGRKETATITLSMFFFKSTYFTEWNLVFADAFLISLPVLIAYIFLQRYIVKGMTSGALKA